MAKRGVPYLVAREKFPLLLAGIGGGVPHLVAKGEVSRLVARGGGPHFLSRGVPPPAPCEKGGGGGGVHPRVSTPAQKMHRNDIALMF